jgi:hypothetical protein
MNGEIPIARNLARQLGDDSMTWTSSLLLATYHHHGGGWSDVEAGKPQIIQETHDIGWPPSPLNGAGKSVSPQES